MKIVDLSHVLYDGSPSYPSDPSISITRKKEYIKHNSMLHKIEFSSHAGTHLDVPAHIIKGGKTLSDFPLNTFMGKMIKINESCIENIRSIRDEIDGVIYDTGWYRFYNNPEIYFGKNRPSLPQKLIEITRKKSFKIFGCDLPSVDQSGVRNKVIHKALLSNDCVIYESLTNLNHLPINEVFSFYGLPLNFQGLDGSPVRAFAILN